MCFKYHLSMSLVTDLMFVVTDLVCCILWIWWYNFMQFLHTVKKILTTKLLFCKQSCVQYAVKFVNAVPITCNHPKIGIINPGFPLATPLPCPSSYRCATCLMIYLCAWVKSVDLHGDDKNNNIKYSY